MNNTRLLECSSLTTPEALQQDLPISEKEASFVFAARKTIADILHKKDERLLVIVGPCSIHDEAAALEYSERLRALAARYTNELFIVMRTYFEKPRSVIGWKGFISDPYLDGSAKMNDGIRRARKLLLQITQHGLPCATEFLDTIIPQYLTDLISWTVVGARTSESQAHRELASGLAMPVGFKNSTDGNVRIAIDAAKSARHPHQYLGISQQGTPAVFHTTGNVDTHVVLRGGRNTTNFDRKIIEDTSHALDAEQLCASLIVDCSHGNSHKDFTRQKDVVSAVINQIVEYNTAIAGVMLESNLVAGKQLLTKETNLVFGQSITDGCISWMETEALLVQLAQAAQQKKRNTRDRRIRLEAIDNMIVNSP